MIEKEITERSGILTEIDSSLVNDITELVQSGGKGMIINLVSDLYPADLARLLTHLHIDDAKVFFSWLAEEQASEVLTDLDDDYRATLLERIAGPARDWPLYSRCNFVDCL